MEDNAKLIEYLKHNLAQGRSKEEIITFMVNHGYPADHILNLLNDIQNPQSEIPQPEKTHQPQQKKQQPKQPSQGFLDSFSKKAENSSITHLLALIFAYSALVFIITLSSSFIFISFGPFGELFDNFHFIDQIMNMASPVSFSSLDISPDSIILSAVVSSFSLAIFTTISILLYALYFFISLKILGTSASFKETFRTTTIFFIVPIIFLTISQIINIILYLILGKFSVITFVFFPIVGQVFFLFIVTEIFKEKNDLSAVKRYVIILFPLLCLVAITISLIYSNFFFLWYILEIIIGGLI
ncbi:MAG: hypothetical protein GY861_27770 [bacterium]|nr:hypothetical protein [bacterium]